VNEQEGGVYELIDGLQRVSSYFHFRGQLPPEADPEKKRAQQLTLVDCDVIPALNGKT
jgi:hypothetical protein